MGNQESIPSDRYVIKKKKPLPMNQINQTNQMNRTNQMNQMNQMNQVNQVNKVNQINNKNKSNLMNEYVSNNQISTNNSTNIRNIENNRYNNNKIIEKQNSNNAIVERSMFLDIYSNNNNNNNIIQYPSNSNNELSIPKANFDNIEFTPYNFNEEVSKFKKNINDERIDFDNNEKERRRIFEKNENYKKEFLNKQILNFETKYNPWEILGMQNNDYDIKNIKKAYKKNALKYHPDRAGDKYQNKFQLITQAYIYLLSKAEEHNHLDIKLSKKVEDIEYEDNVNEKVENIYINKDKFDINQFNKIFDQYKAPNIFDKGYSDLMKEDIIKNKEENEIFGKKFNNDIFNAHFDNIKNTKKSNSIIEYQEPSALDSSNNNFNQTFLGVDAMDDFGSMNNNNLSYTDYKKAHVDETLLIDVNKVKYKTYNSVDQLESDRSNISYHLSLEDKQRYDYLERKKLEDDNLRMLKQKNYDDMVKNQYDKINRKLIIHK